MHGSSDQGRTLKAPVPPPALFFVLLLAGVATDYLLPLRFRGGEADVDEGPIAVTLTSTDWSGGEVRAHTTNGPVALRIPHDFRSSVVAESEGHGPVSCRGERCPSMHADVAHGEPMPRRIQLGSGPSVIHVSTVNGPVAVREVE